MTVGIGNAIPADIDGDDSAACRVKARPRPVDARRRYVNIAGIRRCTTQRRVRVAIGRRRCVCSTGDMYYATGRIVEESVRLIGRIRLHSDGTTRAADIAAQAGTSRAVSVRVGVGVGSGDVHDAARAAVDLSVGSTGTVGTDRHRTRVGHVTRECRFGGTVGISRRVRCGTDIDSTTVGTVDPAVCSPRRVGLDRNRPRVLHVARKSGSRVAVAVSDCVAADIDIDHSTRARVEAGLCLVRGLGIDGNVP